MIIQCPNCPNVYIIDYRPDLITQFVTYCPSCGKDSTNTTRGRDESCRPSRPWPTPSQALQNQFLSSLKEIEETEEPDSNWFAHGEPDAWVEQGMHLARVQRLKGGFVHEINDGDCFYGHKETHHPVYRTNQTKYRKRKKSS